MTQSCQSDDNYTATAPLATVHAYVWLSQVCASWCCYALGCKQVGCSCVPRDLPRHKRTEESKQGGCSSKSFSYYPAPSQDLLLT